MTDDRIRELAREAWHGDPQQRAIEAAIRTALTEQREEDARVCENLCTGYATFDVARKQCAAAIRGNASAESEWKHD